MLVVLSPAKTLDMASISTGPFLSTEPRMMAQASILLNEMKRKDKTALKKMMGVSDAIADLNYKRFQAFEKQEKKQAALAFDGPAYKGLLAHRFSSKQQAFAQTHLRILCGLYGVLRPFDNVRPYRLEMGNSLEVGEHRNLYQFWDKSITESLVQDMALSGDKESGLIINCASQEYFKSIRPADLPPGCRVVTCDFPGASVFAKRARGLMCRFIIESEVENAEQLVAFTGYDDDCYAFSEAQSTSSKLVFLRQAPTKAKTASAKQKTAPNKLPNINKQQPAPETESKGKGKRVKEEEEITAEEDSVGRRKGGVGGKRLKSGGGNT